MKSILNIWLFVSIILASVLTLWLYFKSAQHVGDISYNPNLDMEAFEPCGDYRIYQYYQTGAYYSGGKKAIKKILLPKVNAEGLPPNGLLTVRFVVNCEGHTGYFRTKMIDPNIKHVAVPIEASKHLYELISELKDWVPGEIQGNPQDSYAQITFKLKNGKITDIF